MAENIKSNDDDYSIGVIKAGDEASGNFKTSCDEANEQLTIRHLLKNNGRNWKIKTGVKGVEKVIESIDGVGTKVQIYTNVFNELIRKNEKKLISDQELLNQSTELWERMLHDLIAMNVDDLRDGEMAVAVTNIIDINHLEGIRGKVFSDSMSIAMYNVISRLGIAMTAGETAILGEPKKVIQLEKEAKEFGEKLKSILFEGCGGGISGSYKKIISDLLSNYNKKREVILKDIEFNIGGTGLGVVGKKEKLSKLKPGQAIVYLQEKPTKNGIIGPRSNGITKIRKYMTQFTGDNWENLTFEQFLNRIGKDKANKLPDELKQELSGLKMWDIATGKTTVFNPFISRVLLGGLDSKPITDISSIIHVTGNPGRKISEGLKGEENLAVDLDLSNIKIPQIIQIIQLLCGISDEEAMGTWNMGIPYVIVCKEKNLDIVLKSAEKNGFIASKVGNIVENNNDNKGLIKGVGVGKTNINL